jgi:hypothetical protein
LRKVLAVGAVLLVSGAFVAGYWPQREKLVQARAAAAVAQRQMAEAQARLARAEARGRLDRLFGQFLALQDAVASNNFGEAQGLSSPFFDGVRDEVARGPDPVARTSLDAILMRRDTVTAGLARGESSVRDALAPIERELRRALGYHLPALPSPRPAPAATAP